MNINEGKTQVDFTQNSHNFYSNGFKVIDMVVVVIQQMITMYIGYLQKHLLSQVIIYQQQQYFRYK